MDKNFKTNFLKGSAAASIGTIISMGFHFVSFMILTRALEKHDLGIYVLILALVQLVSLLSGLGLEISIVKFIAGDESARKEVLFPVCLMKSILLIAAACLFYAGGSITVEIFGQEIADYFLIIPVIFISAGMRDLFYNILQGLNYFRKYAFAQILSAALRVGLILLIIVTNKLTLLNLIYIELITTAGAALFQAFMIPFKNLLHFPGWDTYKSLLNFSFPLYMNNVLTFVYDRVNIFIIGAFLNTASIALYDVAGRIPDAFKKIYQSFIVVYYPNISKLFSQNNKKGAIRLMNKSLAFSSVILAFISLVSFFFGKEIITLLFSDAYKESAFAFSLLMFNFYLRALSNLLGYTLVSAGYSSVPVKVNIVSSIISVGGSILLIPLIGYIGAVYSLLAMNISSVILFNYHLVKRDMAPESFEYYKPLIFIIALGLFSILIPLEVLALKILFLIIFLIASWIWLNGVKEIFKYFFRKIRLKSL
jgi:O-antigen/teichoic acid export membrane protein